MLKNQKGFGIVEVILLVLILGIVGLVAYKVLLNKQPEQVQNQQTSKEAVYKEYCDDNESLCFSYPDSWLVDVQEESMFEAMESAKFVSVESPNGSVLLYHSGIVDKQNGFGDSCAGHPTLDYAVSTRESSQNVEGVDVISYKFGKSTDTKQTLALISSEFKPGNSTVNGCNTFITFDENDKINTVLMTSFLSKKFTDQTVIFTSHNYIREADMEDAKSILNSTHYKQ